MKQASMAWSAPETLSTIPRIRPATRGKLFFGVVNSRLDTQNAFALV